MTTNALAMAAYGSDTPVGVCIITDGFLFIGGLGVTVHLGPSFRRQNPESGKIGEARFSNNFLTTNLL